MPSPVGTVSDIAFVDSSRRGTKIHRLWLFAQRPYLACLRELPLHKGQPYHRPTISTKSLPSTRAVKLPAPSPSYLSSNSQFFPRSVQSIPFRLQLVPCPTKIRGLTTRVHRSLPYIHHPPFHHQKCTYNFHALRPALAVLTATPTPTPTTAPPAH